MSAAERLSEKWTFGREAKLRGQMWDFEDNLSAKDVISRHTSKPERGKGFIYFISLPLIFNSQNFKTARKHAKKASGDLMANARDWRVGVNFIGLTNFISPVIGPNLISCHLKLILVMPLASKTRKLGAFGSYIPTDCSKTELKRNVFQSQNLQPWNTECVKSGALEGGLIFVAFSLKMKYFSRLVVVVVVELKGTGFHLALVFTASLSEVESGVKPCRNCKTFWRIQTKLICCIEDFKVFAGNWTLVLCERNQSLSRKIF